MKFRLKKEKFLDEILKASKIIDFKSHNPSTLGILVDVTWDKITVISTNGSLSYKGILNKENSELEIEESGTFLVKPRLVIDVLKSLDNGFVDFRILEKNELEIFTDLLEFKTNLLDAEDFPNISFGEEGQLLNVNSLEFTSAIHQTIITIDENNKRVNLKGLNLKTKNKEMIFSSTDLFRVSRKIVKLNNELEKDINIIIPYKTIIEIPKIIENYKEFDLFINDNEILVKSGSSILKSNLIQGQFPDIDVAFSEEFNTVIEVDRRNILKTATRTDFNTNEGSNSVISLEIEEKVITVKTSIQEISNLEEKFLDFKLVGEANIVINFNSKFIISALKSFNTKNVFLKLNDSRKPLVIESNEEPNLKQAILPTFLS